MIGSRFIELWWLHDNIVQYIAERWKSKMIEILFAFAPLHRLLKVWLQAERHGLSYYEKLTSDNYIGQMN
jgi:hypothetical protein